MKINVFRTAMKAVTGIVLASGMTYANAVTYYLNDTNLSGFNPTGVPDGTNYVSVTLEYDGSDPTQINFTVTPLDPPLIQSGSNYGIQNFGFNLNGIAFNDITIIDLDPNWSINQNANGDGFGNFDILLSDGGQYRQDPLSFSIAAVGDTLDNYFAATNKGSYFAAHVTDISTGAFTTQDPDSDLASDPAYSCDPATAQVTCSELTSGWFGITDARPPSEIPVPAAIWLFGSGLIGLIGVARKRIAA